MNWSDFLDDALEGVQKPDLPSDVKIPILPNVITEFARKSDNPDVSAKQLSAIIEVDSGLTYELLKHVNSAAIGLKRKAVTPQQAISLLGIRQSKLFLLTRGLRTSLQSAESNSSELIDFNNFWNTNLERALFAREVAKLLRVDFDVAFAGAMMQDMMLPILVAANTDEYKRFLESQSASPTLITEYECEHLKYDHAIAATFLMRSWGFPDDLLSCVLCHHRGIELLNDADLGKTAVAAVVIASLLPDQMQQVPAGLSQLVQIESKVNGLHLEKIAQDVDDQFAELASSADKRIPLVERCSLSSTSA